MSSSRLLATLMLLQLRGRMTATDLAAEFEVSVRTVHRDIDRLSAAGAPVYAERGRSGGFRLHDGYRTRLTGLSDDEAQFALLGGLGAVGADLGIAADLGAAQRKLAASLPPAQGSRAAALAERFLFDPRDWYRRRDQPAQLRAVAEAVWDARQLQLRYDSWQGEVARVVDPLGLVIKSAHWYLVGAVAGTPRIYRVSSILEAAPTGQPAQRPRGFVLASFWADHVAAFERSLLTQTATLRLSAAGARRLAQRSDAAATVLNGRQPDAAGRIEATIPIENIAQAVEAILALGPEVEVLAPPALRRRLAEEAARLTRLYSA